MSCQSLRPGSLEPHCYPLRAMSDQLALSIGQQFEIERMGRVIDATSDIESLRRLSKQLVQAWYCQKAATRWVMGHVNGPPLPGPDPLSFGDPQVPG